MYKQIVQEQNPLSFYQFTLNKTKSPQNNLKLPLTPCNNKHNHNYSPNQISNIWYINSPHIHQHTSPNNDLDLQNEIKHINICPSVSINPPKQDSNDNNNNNHFFFINKKIRVNESLQKKSIHKVKQNSINNNNNNTNNNNQLSISSNNNTNNNTNNNLSTSSLKLKHDNNNISTMKRYDSSDNYKYPKSVSHKNKNSDCVSKKINKHYLDVDTQGSSLCFVKIKPNNKNKGKFKYSKTKTNGKNTKHERSINNSNNNSNNNHDKMLKMKDVLDEIQKETEFIQKKTVTKKENNLQVVSTITYSIMNINKKLFCKCLPFCKNNKIIKE